MSFPVSSAQTARAQCLWRQARHHDLSLARLRLAAQLGDADASLVLGRAPVTPSPLTVHHARQRLRTWLLGLHPWGRPIWVRAAAIAALSALPDWELRYPRDVSPRRALKAVFRWVSCPCSNHATVAAAAAAGIRHAALDFAANAARQVALATADARPHESLLHAVSACEDAAWVAVHPNDIRNAIRDALAPWVLRERVSWIPQVVC